MKIFKRRWWLAAAAAVLVAVSAVLTTVGSGGANAAPSRATAAKAGGLGQLTGLLPRDKLTEESALQVDLSKETVRLPLYPGTAHGRKVWYVLLDASDAGLGGRRARPGGCHGGEHRRDGDRRGGDARQPPPA